jgi:molybdate transport system permease protein
MWLLGVTCLIFLALPVVGLVVRAPWGDAVARVARPGVTEAMWLSALCSTAATGVAVVLGVPLAWLLARQDLPGKAVVRAVVLVPLLLPPIVGGIGLLAGVSGLP